MQEYVVKFRRQEQRDIRIQADTFDVDEPVVIFYKEVTGGNKPVSIVLLDELLAVIDQTKENI